MRNKYNKKEIILENIIREYLKKPEPIGSEQLKTKLKIKISSSTIRSYFKKLEDGGLLMQIHISSGRVPTSDALKDYWVALFSSIDTLNIKSIQNLENFAKSESIFFIIKYLNENTLVDILNIKDRYLLLIFENGEIVIDYSNALERFLQGFLGFEAEDLRNICNQVGAFSVSRKITKDLINENTHRDGKKEIIDMYSKNTIDEDMFLDFLNGDAIDSYSDGVSFLEDEYLLFKQDALIENRSAKFLSIGHISRNFENFINQVINRKGV